MKIAVYAIALNEEHNLDAFLANTKDADEVVLCDSGGTNYAFGYRISVNPWDFSIARNTALALVSWDVDLCIRLDLDERLPDNWRTKLEELWPFDQLWYTYQFSPSFSYQYNVHVHPRHGVWWEGIDHETLFWDNPPVSKKAPDFKISHFPKEGRSGAAILPRLERAVRLRATARNLWYLGREYFYYERWDDCLATFRKYLDVGTWDIERMDAYCMMARSYEKLGFRKEAKGSALQAVWEFRCRESLFEVARHSSDERWIKEAMAYTKQLGTIHAKPHLWRE